MTLDTLNCHMRVSEAGLVAAHRAITESEDVRLSVEALRVGLCAYFRAVADAAQRAEVRQRVDAHQHREQGSNLS